MFALSVIIGLSSANVVATVTIGFNANSGIYDGWTPPDHNGAAGPNHIVSAINSKVSIFTKTGTLLSSQTISAITGVTAIDPEVLYDELAQRFVFEASDPKANKIVFAVSKSSDPTQGWYSHVFSFPSPPYDGGRLGYNADAYVLMFPFSSTDALKIIAKASALTGGFTSYYVTIPPSNAHPTTMQNSVSGDPYWLLGQSGNNVILYKLTGPNGTGILTTNIAITSKTIATSGAVGSDHVSEFRNGHIVTLGANSTSVHWVDIDMSSFTLAQEGFITPPDGSTPFTDYGSGGLAPNGSIGINYLSHTNAMLEMWVTGRVAADPVGTMAASVKAASGSYSSPNRLGDYCSTVVDPVDDSFWAFNESDNVGQTAWITHFSLSSPAVKLGPTADSYVRNGTYANTNFGSATTMTVKSDAPGYNRHAFMTFDTSSASSVSKAVINLYVAGVGSDSSRTITVYAQPTTTWGESTLTWNNAPTPGSQLGTFNVSNTSGIWYTFDVTGYVQAQRFAGHKIVSFELINNSSADSNGLVNFATKEASTGQPMLAITP